jgi:hypothetical protein
MASKNPKMSIQGTNGKGKYVTLMIPQKLEIMRRLEYDKSQREVMASCNIGLLTVCDIKKQKGQ